MATTPQAPPVDNPRGRSCQACHYVGVVSGAYVCRLNPPTVIQSTGQPGYTSVWPSVLATDWCTEFANITPPSGIG